MTRSGCVEYDPLGPRYSENKFTSVIFSTVRYGVRAVRVVLHRAHVTELLP